MGRRSGEITELPEDPMLGYDDEYACVACEDEGCDDCPCADCGCCHCPGKCDGEHNCFADGCDCTSQETMAREAHARGEAHWSDK